MPLMCIKRSDIANVTQIYEMNIPKSHSRVITRRQFYLSKMVSDILVQISDMYELESTSLACKCSAELTVGILLQGELNFSLDGTKKRLKVESGERPICFAFNALSNMHWQRHLIKNNHVKKALICLPHGWLQKRFRGNDELDVFIQWLQIHHASFYSCIVSFPQYRAAEALVDAGKRQASEFEIEGLALTLIAECLKNLKQQYTIDQPSNHLSAFADSDSLKICKFIEEKIVNSHHPMQLNLNDLAQKLGMSISTAQRQFKRDFKQTIMEYVRRRRLELARDQLLNKLTIGEAAYLAGYTHTSNFSLAFKKHFGISPGDVCNIDAKR